MDPTVVRRARPWFAVALLVGLAMLPAATAGAALASHPSIVIPSHAPGVRHSTTTSSTNWAGWAVTATSGSVTDVKGSWIVPKIQGTCPSKSQFSSFWVGIDGYSSSTVEQTGTDSDCQSGSPTYYAWYEFYPAGSHLITTVPVHSGDKISAEVKFVSGHFTVKLSDKTTGKSFSKNATVSGASRNSAEWIAEAPSSSSGILPLADFGTVGFGKAKTGLNGTCSATIGSVHGGIGAFSTNAVSITMVNSAGTATKASTGPLYSSGTSFNVTWKSAGP